MNDYLNKLMGKWKIALILFLAVILAWPLGKVGATLGQQFIAAIYEATTVSQAIPTEETSDEAVIEGKINSFANNEKIIFEDQTIYDKWLAVVDAKDKTLYLFNTDSGDRIIVSNTPGYKKELRLFKNNLIWEESEDIWAYSIKDKTLDNITNTPHISEEYPDIYGNLVIYRGETKDIYSYDLIKKEQKNLSQVSEGWRSKPSIWKDTVAWLDDTDGSRNVFVYDLKTGIKQKITNYTDNRYVGDPRVVEKGVVFSYMDHSEKTQLMLYNSKNGNMRQMPYLPGGKFELDVDKFDGGSLVWKKDDEKTVLLDVYTEEHVQLEEMEKPTIYDDKVIGYNAKDKEKVKVRKNPKKKNDAEKDKSKDVNNDVYMATPN